MLVLSRKQGEKIQIADNIMITVVRIQGEKVRIGIEAPKDVSIHRGEIAKLIADGVSHSKPNGGSPSRVA